MNRHQATGPQSLATAKRSKCRGGFAIIVTVSILVLLAVIAVGLLTLSTVAVRSSTLAQSSQEAKANARLALILAIGDLQKTLGNDQFVSAPAATVQDPSTPPQHYTGAWAARENPRDPNSKDALGNSIDYESSQAFSQWLVSDANPTQLQDESFLQNGTVTDPVEIVGTGSSSANGTGTVLAGRIPVEGKGGRDQGQYAWWVSENSTKAMMRLEDKSMREGHGRGEALLAGGVPGPYGIESINNLNLKANTTEIDKLISFRETELLTGLNGEALAPEILRDNFHDVTVHSKSLLTNVTAGGLRKDLSLYFEGDPEDGDWLGSILERNAPTGPHGKNALSPHDEYDTGSWKVLHQHYALHKTPKSSSESLLTGSVGETLIAVDDFNPPSGNRHPYPTWNSQRKLIKPVIARMSYVLSIGVQDASTGQVPADRLNSIRPRTKPYDAGRNKYIVTFHAYPVVALWNPYTMNLDCEGFSVGNMGMSVEHNVAVGGDELEYQWIDHSFQSNNGSWNVIGMTVDRSFTMEPGEVKMFFATDEVFRRQSQFYARGTSARGVSGINFDSSPSGGPYSAGIVKNGVVGSTFNAGDSNFPGHLLLNGLFANVNDTIYLGTNIFTPQGSKNSGPRSDFNGLIYYATYSSWDIRMITRSFRDWRTTALWWTQWGGGSQREKASKWTNKIGWRNDLGSPIILDEPINATVNVADLIGGRKQPYMVVDLRLKGTESDPDQRNPNITWLHNIPGHGYAGCSGQTSPGVSVSGAGNVVTETHARPYTVVYEPVQSANQAWNFLQLDAVDNEVRPFMGNSFWPGGQHKAVAMEIPITPLQSIAQFQHVPQVPIDATRWSGLSLQNYAIGNSYPNPNVPSDKISNNGWKVWLDTRTDNSDSRTNMKPDLDGVKWHESVNGSGPSSEHFKPTKHIDRSYVANTLLWDDFFFSGLAEQTGDFFRRAGGTVRTLDTVITDFVNGSEPLPNSRFRANLLTREAESVIADLTGKDNYRKAAAHIDVIGGFNVNSTSKVAWKAFLTANLKKKQVILTSRGRPSNTMPESTLEEYIISRFSLANGAAQDISSSSSEKWLGYRVVKEADLDDLAEKMVEEVKTRGPFRSIGEFVNRRLTGADQDTALRGALQAALDRSTVNLELAQDTISTNEIGGTDYAFQNAALLSRHAGSPPYILQGDLLQSIGALIQVRSDTFTIRAYGESADGEAKAWCEAVVQRNVEWIDPTDAPAAEFADTTPVNQKFGRRFQIVSFRWLAPNEV